jgi:hypothetical protein
LVSNRQKSQPLVGRPDPEKSPEYPASPRAAIV